MCHGSWSPCTYIWRRRLASPSTVNKKFAKWFCIPSKIFTVPASTSPKPHTIYEPVVHTILSIAHLPTPILIFSHFLEKETPLFPLFSFGLRWLAPSRPLANPPEVRHRGSNWLRRPQGNLHRQLGEWRNLTALGQGRWLWGRSGSTRRVRSSWSGSFHSRGWWEKLPRISKPIFGSRAVQWLLCKRLRRLIWLVCLRTPISVLSTPKESPLCPRIFSLLVGLEARGLRGGMCVRSLLWCIFSSFSD